MAASTVPGFTNRRLWLVLTSLMLAVFLASMETSIIATALPTIAGDFNAFESFAWVGTVYIATSAIGTPLLGKLSDLYGRRLIFQTTMATFVIGSFLCGLAPSMGWLIAFRALQGFGGGGIQALAFAVLGDILPPRERGRFIGYFTLSFVGAALLGPVIGGFIIDHYDWAWIFLINVPLGLLVMVACHYALRLPFQRRDAKLDLRGAALLSLAVGALMVGLAQGGEDGWSQPIVLALFGVSVATTLLFVRSQRRVPEPMLPLHLFSNRVMLVCIGLGVFAGLVTYGAGSFLPLYFQVSQFVSPTLSGLRMAPQMLGVSLATFGIGRLIARTGRYRIFPIIGTSVATVGLLSVAQIDGDTSYWWLLVPMMFMGFGAASIFTTTSIAGQNAVEVRDLGVATSTMMFFRSLGGSLGYAAFGTILNATVRAEIPKSTDVTAAEATKLIRTPAAIKELPANVRDAVTDSVALGVSRIYWVCGIAMACAILVALALPEKPLRMRAGLSDAMEQKAAAAAD